MDTNAPVQSTEYREDRDRLTRTTPAIVLIAVAAGCWAITAWRMQGMLGG